MPSGKEVEVKVGNGLSTVGAIVDDHPEPFFGVAFLAGNVSDP